ncbi:MAG TPA: DUF2059 domain-containing protein [Pyrinomonadaceae bacterium]
MRRMNSLATIFLFLLSLNVYAQGVSSEKKDLIKELLTVIDATKNAEAIMDSISAQIQKDMLQGLGQMIENDKSLSNAQRAEIQQEIAASAQRSANRFRELFRKRIDFSQLVKEVIYEVYDKYYSAVEIRDLIAFYKTPTGRKSIEIMSQLFTESMTKTSERLTPLVQPILQEIIDEEMKKIEKLVPKPPPRRKSR